MGRSVKCETEKSLKVSEPGELAGVQGTCIMVALTVFYRVLRTLDLVHSGCLRTLLLACVDHSCLRRSE
jgi:hypothetical protein